MGIDDSDIPHQMKLTQAIFDAFEEEMGTLTEEMQVGTSTLIFYSHVLIYCFYRQLLLVFVIWLIYGLIQTSLAIWQLHHITIFVMKMVTGRSVAILLLSNMYKASTVVQTWQVIFSESLVSLESYIR